MKSFLKQRSAGPNFVAKHHFLSFFFFKKKISQALDNYLAISILRVKEGLDCSHLIGGLEENIPRGTPTSAKGPDRVSSAASMGFENIMEVDPTDPEANEGKTNEVQPATLKGNKIVFVGKDKRKEKKETLGIYR